MWSFHLVLQKVKHCSYQAWSLYKTSAMVLWLTLIYAFVCVCVCVDYLLSAEGGNPAGHHVHCGQPQPKGRKRRAHAGLCRCRKYLLPQVCAGFKYVIYWLIDYLFCRKLRSLYVHAPYVLTYSVSIHSTLKHKCVQFTHCLSVLHIELGKSNMHVCV